MKGAVAAPHREAEFAGASVLAEGGNAIEAAVATAAALSVAYPHMTGLGGDAFWLIAEPGKAPVGLRACGPAARSASGDWYRAQAHLSIPSRGPAAALTVAGAVSGWALALELSASWGGKHSRERLFSDARRLALQGVAASRSQVSSLKAKAGELLPLPGFTPLFASSGLPAEGSILVQPRLAAVFDQLARSGLDDFYRGDLARSIAADLQALGSPLAATDFEIYRAAFVEPLSVELSVGTVWNLPPPTQGVSSLAILALFDRLGITEPDGFAHVHGLVEATKKAFAWRNAHVGDPAFMRANPHEFLASANLDSLARSIGSQAAPWPHPEAPGDTVWFGAVDAQGRMVSVIQSLYWEFGSGIVLPETGLLWQNRGSSFTLTPGPNSLTPGRLPFHTLNPAFARLKDGRSVAYGTMGGEGQPQTQAAFLTRYAWFGQGLAEALSAPRWLLGRTWGEETTVLRLESRANAPLIENLKAAGHPVELVGEWDDRMGHAGAVVLHPDGSAEAGHDPRADGAGLLAEKAPAELLGFLNDLAEIGADAGGVTRLLYDSAWGRARQWLETRFASVGLTVRGDRVGNLYGRLEGTDGGKTILTGSHFDTVRQGGWYDGAYGVAASAVALANLQRRHGPPPRSVKSSPSPKKKEAASRSPTGVRAVWSGGGPKLNWSSAIRRESLLVRPCATPGSAAPNKTTLSGPILRRLLKSTSNRALYSNAPATASASSRP